MTSHAEYHAQYASRFASYADHQHHIPLVRGIVAHISNPDGIQDGSRTWYFAASRGGEELGYGVAVGDSETTVEDAKQLVIHQLIAAGLTQILSAHNN